MEILMLVAVAFVVALLALIVWLVRLVSKGAARPTRTVWLSAAFAVVAFVSVGVFAAASINYRMPAIWSAAVAAVLVALVILAAAIGRELSWDIRRLIALAGIFLVASLAFGTLMTAGVGNVVLRRLYSARVTQIAQESGFTALMPANEELPTDMLPVDEIPGPDQGVVMEYSGFQIQERKASAEMTQDDLLEILAPGATPRDDTVVPDDARITTLTVAGRPAVAASFTHRPGGAVVKASATETVAMLVTVIDGVEVRLWLGGMEKLIDGEWKLYGAFTPDELVAIAESLEPVK